MLEGDLLVKLGGSLLSCTSPSSSSSSPWATGEATGSHPVAESSMLRMRLVLEGKPAYEGGNYEFTIPGICPLSMPHIAISHTKVINTRVEL